jgi:hypothetical protein
MQNDNQGWFKPSAAWLTLCALVPVTSLVRSGSEASRYLRSRIRQVCRSCHPQLNQADLRDRHRTMETLGFRRFCAYLTSNIDAPGRRADDTPEAYASPIACRCFGLVFALRPHRQGSGSPNLFSRGTDRPGLGGPGARARCPANHPLTSFDAV